MTGRQMPIGLKVLAITSLCSAGISLVRVLATASDSNRIWAGISCGFWILFALVILMKARRLDRSSPRGG